MLVVHAHAFQNGGGPTFKLNLNGTTVWSAALSNNTNYWFTFYIMNRNATNSQIYFGTQNAATLLAGTSSADLSSNFTVDWRVSNTAGSTTGSANFLYVYHVIHT